MTSTDQSPKLAELRVPPRIGEAAERSIRIALVTGGLVAIAGFAVLFAFNPAQHAFYPRCFLHEFTGISCPGCGGLRAMHELLHGHFLEALRLNALFVVSLPVAALWALNKLFRPHAAPIFRSSSWLWAALAVAVLFGVLRNLPAFSWLAP
jgi:hypothetical protein